MCVATGICRVAALMRHFLLSMTKPGLPNLIQSTSNDISKSSCLGQVEEGVADLHVGPGSQEGRMCLGCVCPLLEEPAGCRNVALMPLQGCPCLQDDTQSGPVQCGCIVSQRTLVVHHHYLIMIASGAVESYCASTRLSFCRRWTC